MTLIIYDEEVSAEVALRLAEFGQFMAREEFVILQSKLSARPLFDILLPVAPLQEVKKSPAPWQNATPYLKRKKGRS